MVADTCQPKFVTALCNSYDGLIRKIILTNSIKLVGNFWSMKLLISLHPIFYGGHDVEVFCWFSPSALGRFLTVTNKFEVYANKI